MVEWTLFFGLPNTREDSFTKVTCGSMHNPFSMFVGKQLDVYGKILCEPLRIVLKTQNETHHAR